MPTMTTVYENERAARLAKYENYPVPPQDFSYEIKIETEARRVSDVGTGVCTHVNVHVVSTLYSTCTSVCSAYTVRVYQCACIIVYTVTCTLQEVECRDTYCTLHHPLSLC